MKLFSFILLPFNLMGSLLGNQLLTLDESEVSIKWKELSDDMK